MFCSLMVLSVCCCSDDIVNGFVFYVLYMGGYNVYIWWFCCSDGKVVLVYSFCDL